MALTDQQRDAVPVLTRALRETPSPVLRRMAESATPTTAAVARSILDSREDGKQPDQIFSS